MGVIDSAELPAGWSHHRYVLKVWLFTPEKPAMLDAAAARVADGSADLRHAPAAVSNLIECLGANARLEPE